MTYIYFVSDGEFIKIGIAKDVRARMHNLQTGNPKRLKLLKTIECNSNLDARIQEETFHRKYRKYSACGEWFRMNDELCNYVGVINEARVGADLAQTIKQSEEHLAMLNEQTIEMHNILKEEHRQLSIAQERHLKVLSETLRLQKANRKEKTKKVIRHTSDYLSYGAQAWGAT